ERLRHRRMGVHGPDHFFHCSFELKPHASLCYKLGRMRADYVGAKHLVVASIADDLDHPFSSSQYLRLPDHWTREMPNLDFVAPLPRLGLGQPYACDFRLAIGAAWNVIVVQRLRILPGNCFNRDDSLC